MANPAVTHTTRQAIWIALLVAVTFFMENLDATVIATALPQMARDFAENPVSLNIGISAYLLVLAIFAGNLAMKPFTTGLLRRHGFRRVLLVNGLIGVGCILACLLLQQGMPWYWMVLVLFIGGLSRSMQFTTYNAVGFAEVPKAQMGEASTLFSMFFQLAMALGVAIAALLLRVSMLMRGGRKRADGR